MYLRQLQYLQIRQKVFAVFSALPFVGDKNSLGGKLSNIFYLPKCDEIKITKIWSFCSKTWRNSRFFQVKEVSQRQKGFHW